MENIKTLLATDDFKWMVLNNEDTDSTTRPPSRRHPTQAGILITHGPRRPTSSRPPSR
jgi:hypothetical protein